jgi:gliding motility-associated transport system ATP-binding protein
MIMQVRGLVVGYGARSVLHGVDLDLVPGEILGLLGPNGAGKSTLLRRMAGVLPSREGGVEVVGAGDPATDLPARARIGYMPEAPSLYPDETALRYVTYLADLAGIPRRRRREAALEALQRTGAAKLADRLAGRLSKGQRQRVAMAGAIVHDPEVILLDEPGEGLDPRQTVALRALLRDLAGPSAVLFSTHLLAEAQLACDRIVILDQGVVVAERPAQDFVTSRLRVRVADADADAFRGLVLSVPGVISEHDGVCVVTSDDAADAIAAAVRAEGWKLIELARVSDDLETAFLNAVAEGAQ